MRQPKTVIQYEYRAASGRGHIFYPVGPVILSRPDNGSDPMEQASEWAYLYGDMVLRAWRCPAPDFGRMRL